MSVSSLSCTSTESRSCSPEEVPSLGTPKFDDASKVELSMYAELPSILQKTSTLTPIQVCNQSEDKPFGFYYLQERPALKKEYPNLSIGEITRKLAEKWKLLSPSQKASYARKENLECLPNSKAIPVSGPTSAKRIKLVSPASVVPVNPHRVIETRRSVYRKPPTQSPIHNISVTEANPYAIPRKPQQIEEDIVLPPPLRTRKPPTTVTPVRPAVPSFVGSGAARPPVCFPSGGLNAGKVNVTASIAAALGLGLGPKPVAPPPPPSTSVASIVASPRGLTMSGNIIPAHQRTKVVVTKANTNGDDAFSQIHNDYGQTHTQTHAAPAAGTVPASAFRPSSGTLTSPREALDMFYLALCEPAFPRSDEPPLTPYNANFCFDAYIRMSQAQARGLL